MFYGDQDWLDSWKVEKGFYARGKLSSFAFLLALWWNPGVHIPCCGQHRFVINFSLCLLTQHHALPPYVCKGNFTLSVTSTCILVPSTSNSFFVSYEFESGARDGSIFFCALSAPPALLNHWRNFGILSELSIVLLYLESSVPVIQSSDHHW